MRSTRALLTDLDRTLTGPDLVPDPRALRRIAALEMTGVKVVVVSGRRLDHMLAIGLGSLASGLVAENGAVVSVPPGRDVRTFGVGFADRARSALGPLGALFSWSLVLGSGPRDAAPEAAERLRAAGVRFHLEFNAEEVMILPEGVDKASGARAALERLRVRAEDAAAIGDGENDVALFRLAAVSAAPANACRSALDAARVRCRAAYADGFIEFTDAWVRPGVRV